TTPNSRARSWCRNRSRRAAGLAGPPWRPDMWTRRAFLRATGAVGTSAIAARASLADVAAASSVVADRPADEVAQDETYLRAIQEAYAPDRTLINLNNGHHSPAPRIVHDALKHYLDSEN